MPINIGGTTWSGTLANALDYKSIIKTGLILHLDPKVAESYPGSGTSWYDLSGNGNHGTLQNSPTFTSSATAPYITFSRASDNWWQGPVSLNGLTDGINFSASLWVMFLSYPDASASNSFLTFGRYGWTGGSNGWEGFYNSDGSVGLGGRENNTLYIVSGSSSSTYPINQIWNMVWFKNGTTWGVYVNGNLAVSASAGNGTTSVFQNSAAPLAISRVESGATYTMNARVYHATLYNRALSQAEIQHNFNTLRDRYGI